MIQIESIHIEEFRGIRDLSLTMNCGNFVVSGPNGSGKSGVVDAIQFALTGQIARLQGSGTGVLKLSEHGPHVGEQTDPRASKVTLNVHIPYLGKSASIARSINNPRKPKITPNDSKISEVFAQMEQHPEITFARREVIKFILAGETKRSRDVQTLLKLEDIDQIRKELKSAESKLNTAYSKAKTQVESNEDSLKRHLDVETLASGDLSEVINAQRQVLDLPEITDFAANASLSTGLSDTGKTEKTAQTKDAALRDLKALSDAITDCLETSTANAVLQDIRKIEADTELLTSIKREPFIQSGFDLVDGPYCPLCDTEWDMENLRTYLQKKVEKSNEAKKLGSPLLLVQQGRSMIYKVGHETNIEVAHATAAQSTRPQT